MSLSGGGERVYEPRDGIQGVRWHLGEFHPRSVCHALLLDVVDMAVRDAPLHDDRPVGQGQAELVD